MYKNYMMEQNISGNRMDKMQIQSKIYKRNQLNYTALPKIKDEISQINTQEISTLEK